MRLEEICRFIEKATNQLQDLSFLVLKIELLDSFENLNKASPKGIIKSPAAYQCSEERIIVNSRIFLNLEMPIKVATIMHEVAHAYLHLINPGLKEREFKDKDIDEELIADYLVCGWGFEEQIIAERTLSYGELYSDALRLWRDREKFLEAITIAYTKILIGNN
ncbi:MAG: hypothetical protein AABY51_09145 [Deltaproteobacteria bacterium]